MKWKKLGNIFHPDQEAEWMNSHAANPFPLHLRADVFRIFFTCRNRKNQSHIGFVDIDFGNNFKIVRLSKSPVLSPGQPGLFDDSGVAAGCLLNYRKKLYLYYLGWNLKVTVPWMNTIGLAVWDEKKRKFIKHGRAPIMDRSEEDPFSISYPFVRIEKNKFRMWYGSNLTWGAGQDE